MTVENESLELLTPPPLERLESWLSEFYGKRVTIRKRELLRHRDLSFVERLYIADSLPQSLIYKVVLPPWDVEQDLHERVLIPSISNSAQLYMAAHFGRQTALFLEDLGTESLHGGVTTDLAFRLGKELAKLHRAYCYRTDELNQLGVVPTLYPIDYEDFAAQLGEKLSGWGLIATTEAKDISLLANLIAPRLAGEPISLVHGDLYAENLIVRDERIFIIDWSWFTHIGAPAMDLATLTMAHTKNGSLTRHKEEILDAYCFESGRNIDDLRALLPFAETLSRVLFLHWLAERRERGIMGTTIGPVDGVIAQVMAELSARLSLIPA